MFTECGATGKSTVGREAGEAMRLSAEVSPKFQRYDEEEEIEKTDAGNEEESLFFWFHRTRTAYY